jgi:hypothetical protein
LDLGLVIAFDLTACGRPNNGARFKEVLQMPTQKRDKTSVVPAAIDCPAADEPVKTCGKCSRSLPLSQFYRDAHARDGYFRQCLACHRITVRAWTRKNLLRINAWRRQRYRQNIELMRAQNREWYAANREKFKQWSREYRAEHREEIRAKAAEHTRRNRHSQEVTAAAVSPNRCCFIVWATPRPADCIRSCTEDYQKMCSRHHHQLHAELFCLLPPFEEYYAGVPRRGRRMSLFGAML